MDYLAARGGQYTCLKTEALRAISSSAQLFVNAPTGTVWIRLTVLGQAIWINWGNNGVAATAVAAAGSGCKYAVGGPYQFEVTYTQALLARAIEDAATCTGTIEYWGVQ